MAWQPTESSRSIGEATQPLAPPATGSAEPAARDRPEEIRRQSDDRIRLLLETVPIAVLNCDRDGLLEYFNPQAAALWGRVPALRDPRDRFCGSHRIFSVNGEILAPALPD
jgi:PAS domain-containing protein